MTPSLGRPWAFLVLALWLCFGQRADAQCDPLQQAYPTTPGLVNSTYFVDFTQQQATPGDWIQANYENSELWQ